jgi:hypothetical protein
VRNLFCLLAVFISFPLARCAPLPHLAPLFEGGKVPKKEKKENRGRGRGRFVFVALLLRDLSSRESDPRPKGPGPGFSDVIFAYCAISFSTFLIWSASLLVGLDELGRPRRCAVLVSSCFSLVRRVFFFVFWVSSFLLSGSVIFLFFFRSRSH